MEFPKYLLKNVAGVRITPISKIVFRLGEETKENKDNSKQKLLIITGFSGAGKDSAIDLMTSLDKRFGRVKTCTTRKQRPEEKECDPYLRFDKEGYQKALSSGDVIESVFYAGEYYFSLYSALERTAQKYEIPILRIDPSGLAFYKNKATSGEGCFAKMFLKDFFIVPPTVEVLQERLLARSQDEAFVAKRLKQMTDDAKFLKEAEYVVVNQTDRLEKTTEEIMGLV